MPRNASASSVDLGVPETFDHWVSVTLRFADQDTWGHINNVAYGSYIGEGRTVLVGEILEALDRPDLGFLLASVKIDFRSEMHYPGIVEVGSRLLSLGKKSTTLGHGLFKDKRSVATAESVIVFAELESGKTIPVPDAVRRIMAREGAGPIAGHRSAKAKP